MDFDTYYLLALRYVTIRFRSEKEIRDYLKKKLKKVPDQSQMEQLIDLVVHRLKEQKFLNDTEFAKMWIRSRTEFKPKGERLIRLELLQKGVSKEIIAKAFEAFHTTQKENNETLRDDKILAKALLEKKRKKFEHMERQERFRKAGSFLARRGFDLDIIKAAIEEVFEK